MKQSPEDFRMCLEDTLEAVKRGPRPKELKEAPRLDRWQCLTDDKCVVICGIEVGLMNEAKSAIRTTAVFGIDRDWRWIRTMDGWYQLSSRLASPDDRSEVLLKSLHLPQLTVVDQGSARIICALFVGECLSALTTGRVAWARA